MWIRQEVQVYYYFTLLIIIITIIVKTTIIKLQIFLINQSELITFQ